MGGPYRRLTLVHESGNMTVMEHQRGMIGLALGWRRWRVTQRLHHG